jgi:5-methylcytosine-specific restriction endonuclease McrA
MPMIAREALSELFDGECAYCDAPATSWDHFIPVTMGGRTTPGNMLPACTPCNSKKKNRDPQKWLDIAPNVKVFTIEYLTMMGTI